MTRDKLIAMLLRIKGKRTQLQLAEELGVSPQYIGDVLAGNREPGKKVLDALKLERVVMYKPVSAKESK
jgi:transcriptional regulator with XRE-family HTH domain